MREGALAPTTDAVPVLTGREPRRFAEFAREHAAAFGAGDPETADGAVAASAG
jgi:hypothetical protein